MVLPRSYKTRAYRFLNAEKVAKAERREAEKQRVRAEKAAEAARIENDRRMLEEADAAEAKKVRAPGAFFQKRTGPAGFAPPGPPRRWLAGLLFCVRPLSLLFFPSFLPPPPLPFLFFFFCGNGNHNIG